ncbi:hypothetical protein HPU229336_04300 [Helicobacter pullorum]|uniref:Dihydroneopterin aldolase n=1 Tax=Helicobacter pullorum TaxID=35818 RepID=A0AAW3J4C9_9HELI|nr:hypothetical protein [Helicobacter pullorum]KPH50147.1 hypothetical protein HPU229336_04300 [Helicobacter pullorum]
MKIALISDSLLLDRTLEMYLKDYLTSYKLCDFVVATQPVDSQKPVFLIGEYENANLHKPFTKEILLQALEAFFLQIRGEQEAKEEEEIKYANVESANWNEMLKDVEIEEEKKPLDLELYQKIFKVLENYAKEITMIVQEHYKEKNNENKSK